MNYFYLVRHAHANWEPSEQRPLSTRGMLASAQVADVLAPYPISAIFSSPYRRAIQTVESFAQQQHIPITILPMLRERQLAGEPVDNFDEAIEMVWRDPHFAHPGGESNVVAQRRGVAVLEELRQRYDQESDNSGNDCINESDDDANHIVLATHGNLLALILQHYDPAFGYGFWKSMTMPDIYRLGIDRRGNSRIERIEHMW